MVWQSIENDWISNRKVYCRKVPKNLTEALFLVQRFKPPQGGNLPIGSRTIVTRITQVSLTAGFGMRPGVSLPLWPSNHHMKLFTNNELMQYNLFNDWVSKWAVSSQRAEHVAEAPCVHPGPIKRVFYSSSMMPRFKVGFMLRCFQHLSLTAWLPSIALSDNW